MPATTAPAGHAAARNVPASNARPAASCCFPLGAAVALSEGSFVRPVDLRLLGCGLSRGRLVLEVRLQITRLGTVSASSFGTIPAPGFGTIPTANIGPVSAARLLEACLDVSDARPLAGEVSVPWLRTIARAEIGPVSAPWLWPVSDRATHRGSGPVRDRPVAC